MKMDKIKTILNFLKNNWKNILLIMFAIVIVILLLLQGFTRTDNRNLKNNIKALTDSMQVLETKNGDLVYARQALILEKKELEEYLGLSKKEIKELEKTLDDKLSYIAKLEGTVRVDTFTCVDTMYVDSLTHIDFKYKDKWFALSGTTIVSESPLTTINNVQMDVPLQVGLTDNYRIFVKTPNPYVSFTDIEGAVIEKTSNGSKPKRWNLGVQVGIGAGYDLLHKNITVGPYLGVGISYGFGF